MWYGTYVSAALRSGQFDPVHFGTVVDIDHGWLVGVSERLNVTDGTPARPQMRARSISIAYLYSPGAILLTASSGPLLLRLPSMG